MQRSRLRPAAVVVGASAGGIGALRTLFGALSATYPLPIIVALHLRADTAFDWGNVFGRGGLTIGEAGDKQPAEAGQVYFAPPGYHLLVETSGSFALSIDAPVNWARPSIDVLFESAAEAYGRQLVGVILTGANADGAAGLAAVKAKGGMAIVEDPATAEFPIMPRAALAATSVDHVLPVAGIASVLADLA